MAVRRATAPRVRESPPWNARHEMSLRLLADGYRKILVSSALLAGVPAMVNGQEPGSLQAGSRVRVRINESGAKWLQGNLVRVGNDSLSLVTGGGSDTVSLATTAVTQLEVSRGRNSGTGQGLAIGAR